MNVQVVQGMQDFLSLHDKPNSILNIKSEQFLKVIYSVSDFFAYPCRCFAMSYKTYVLESIQPGYRD